MRASVLELPLHADGPKRLRMSEVDGGRWAVALDGMPLRELARVPHVPQFVELPDGSELVAEWRQGLFGAGEGWHVAYGGRPLPGTVGDPARVVDEAALALGWMALLLAIAGAAALAGVPVFHAAGFSGWSLVDAAALALLARRVRRRSLPALLGGIVLLVVGSLYGFQHAIATGVASPGALTTAALMRISFLVAVVRAVPVLWRRELHLSHETRS